MSNLVVLLVNFFIYCQIYLHSRQVEQRGTVVLKISFSFPILLIILMKLVQAKNKIYMLYPPLEAGLRRTVICLAVEPTGEGTSPKR